MATVLFQVVLPIKIKKKPGIYIFRRVMSSMLIPRDTLRPRQERTSERRSGSISAVALSGEPWRIIHKKVGRSLNNIVQRSQEVCWDELWMIGLFCMGLNALNN